MMLLRGAIVRKRRMNTAVDRLDTFTAFRSGASPFSGKFEAFSLHDAGEVIGKPRIHRQQKSPANRAFCQASEPY
jgi:hypothetical protein